MLCTRGLLLHPVGGTKPALRVVSARVCSMSALQSDRRRKGWKQSNFWHKWRERSQQQFWQDVVLSNDKQYERRHSPLKVSTPATDEDADEYDFQLPDSLEMGALDDEYEDDTSETEGHSNQGATVSELRDGMHQNTNVDIRRRAELLSLLEQLGPNALTFAKPRVPKQQDENENMEMEDHMMVRERETDSLAVCSTFLGSVQLRQSGKLGSGQFFAHVLQTRRTAKVTHQGKKISIGVLAVVGNGQGVAGFATGKDADATVALVKAIRAAKKNLVSVERFDQRTIFHDMEEKYKCTKIVIRLRRAGAGTRCSWCIWKILNAFGITDVSVKIHGSTNHLYQAHAFFNAVQRMTTAQMIADRRGQRVLDMTPRSPSGIAGYRAD
mmetsp:Transcript_11897/g.20063  ORF Transcript_11897/g.20063 Transcript_11897/m.20063 type:complete len:383 (+) Transcript_11897:62-1210(+)